MEVDRNGLEILDRDQCLRLLAAATLGRVGFTSAALPCVLPVNFHLDGERILLRTARGTRLDAALQNMVVAFEVDDFDATLQTGWSVAITGVATAISDPRELELTRDQPVTRWGPEEDEAVIAISTAVVSGRRITVGARSVRA